MATKEAWVARVTLCCVVWLAVFASSCGQSKRGLDDAQSGSPPGSGGTAGSDGALDPLNCGADAPVIVPPKDERWIFLEGRPILEQPSGRYLVEITPDGPRGILRLADAGGFRGWSADGRFLAATLSDESPNPISVFDFSQGGFPALVGVPAREGRVSWSRSDARYALLTGETLESLVVVDASTTEEQVIGVPPNLEQSYWSWDGRYVAVIGEGGLVLVDTSGTELVMRLAHDEPTPFEPQFSPDGRYLAFRSHLPERARLFLFDTQTETLELLAEAERNESTSFQFAGNTWLIARIGEHASFFDLTERPLEPLPLAAFIDSFPTGKVSPGSKCYAYRGYCEATNEAGVCVKALPPEPENPSVLLQRDGDERWQPEWAGTGDQLLLIGTFQPWLINVDVDGGDFTSRFIAGAPDDENVHEASFYPRWNPNGRADWIAYVTRLEESSPLKMRLRLWHRETGEDFSLSHEDPSVQHLAWSPDGKYLFVHSDTPGDSAFLVQELRDQELGRAFRISELEPASEAEMWALHWQP